MKQAIGRRAEERFHGLPEPCRASLHEVFRKLVDVDERGVATRRRVARHALVSSPEAGRLVDAFTDARLFVTDRAPDGESVVEVCHEALFREWPLMADWIRERADDLHLERQVEAAAIDWERQSRAMHHTWPHERLAPVYQSFERLGIVRETLEEPTLSFVRPEWERLVLELEEPATTHQRRAAIGDRLDQLGDLRPGVGVSLDGTPDIVWCEIPGGGVALEGAKGNFEVKPFRIAKYPITYCQYKAFLNDPKGYRNKKHWKGLKRKDKQSEQYRRIANCPADSVSWYDAMAFCRWLSARLGSSLNFRAECSLEVRLPFDGEWQQAASGGQPENMYPWGPKWVSAFADTNESRLDRTTAVGMYPRGASSQRVLDLAGNVWEWCLNTSEHPRSRTIKGAARPVLRGGCWHHTRDDARTTRRAVDYPENPSDLIGFRVVCVSQR